MVLSYGLSIPKEFPFYTTKIPGTELPGIFASAFFIMKMNIKKSPDQQD